MVIKLIKENELFQHVDRASSTIVGDTEGSEIKGIVDFCQSVLPFSPVVITMNITGLPMGKHAVHIHTYGDLHAGCKSTGAHFHKNLVNLIKFSPSIKI